MIFRSFLNFSHCLPCCAASKLITPYHLTMTSVEGIGINLNGVDDHSPELPVQAGDSLNREPIAIVGMGMQLPGAIHSGDQLWDLLIEKRTTRSDIPASRFNLAGFHSQKGEAGIMPVHEGHFLAETDPLDAFDVLFFSMGKKEAEALDPQQKLLNCRGSQLQERRVEHQPHVGALEQRQLFLVPQRKKQRRSPARQRPEHQREADGKPDSLPQESAAFFVIAATE